MSNNNRIPFILAYICLFICASAFFILKMPLQNNMACAAAIADTPCDPEYYESLVARATLEADREVVQNQNLIYKPDSVLSYTCFEYYLNVLGREATNMFSETTRWGNVLGGTQSDHMNIALENLVENALFAYLEANFHGAGNRRMLGGRHSADRPQVILNVPDGNYVCDVMERVWMEAKCYNFQTLPEDGFYTFEWYRDNPDVRILPQPCTSPPPYGPNLVTALSSPPWVDDPTITYLDRFNAAQCGSQPALPTGISVDRPVVTPQTYQEFVCIQPGCHYDPASGNCVP